MATYVLVPGAWHGGWCWERVASLLREAGQTVYTPTLTGLAERAGELTERTNLDTHIRDVAGLRIANDVHHAILVGHSYGGMVITDAADRAPERLAHLVYLDAFAPEDGTALNPTGTPPPGFAGTAGLGVPPPPVEVWEIEDEANRRYLDERLMPHPFRTLAQPLRLMRGPAAHVHRLHEAESPRVPPRGRGASTG